MFYIASFDSRRPLYPSYAGSVQSIVNIALSRSVGLQIPLSINTTSIEQLSLHCGTVDNILVLHEFRIKRFYTKMAVSRFSIYLAIIVIAKQANLLEGKTISLFLTQSRQA